MIFPARVDVYKRQVVGSVVDFAGSYDQLLGEIKSDVQEVEFDDVNRGDRPVPVSYTHLDVYKRQQ